MSNPTFASGTSRIAALSILLALVFGALPADIPGRYSFITIIPTVSANDPLGDANEIGGIDDYGGGTNDELRDRIRSVITEILLYTALLATAVIIIGGIILIAGLGSDDSREKTKKIVLYAIVGMILIVLAEGIVVFITTVLP